MLTSQVGEQVVNGALASGGMLGNEAQEGNPAKEPTL